MGHISFRSMLMILLGGIINTIKTNTEQLLRASKDAGDRFLPHPYQFITRCHPLIHVL